MDMKKLPVYLALVGAVACGPSTPRNEPTVFRIDTNKCRITQAETPWRNIEIWYGKVRTDRGRYNSATGDLADVAFNTEYYDRRVPYKELLERSKFGLMQCAREDPERQRRPVGFAIDESSPLRK